ncbi:hypothetical protein DY218_16710 [Streptomyces triticagri]|uniref:LPXTG cell wall anchor domain-containing protein n=1 Tax=Streptomyces triticagri TaxID=2293568 RepID=A0A372M3S6_9ACTN|nr:hypothetical protein [Streptomyces triticagri]RFU85588.1 hypothetical protein DY218_16710 [Streptomyces triticagri]
MRTIRISGRTAPRRGLVLAAVPTVLATPLALLLAASPARADPGIEVSSDAGTVRVSTTDCPTGGTAALMGGGNATFAGGKQEALGDGSPRTATWTSVAAGTYTVAVICSDGGAAGSQRVTVSGSATSPSPTPTPTATSSPTSSPTPVPTAPTAPTGQVMGGLGGADRDATAQIAGGAALALTTGAAGTWLILRRRRRDSSS